MAVTNKGKVIYADVFNEAVQGVFSGKTAFFGSKLVATGAVVVNGSFGGDKNMVGDIIKVPYFGTIGDFVDISVDGDAVIPVTLAGTTETAQVVHKALAIEVTRWARSSMLGDIYQEGSMQLMGSAERAMDKLVIDAAAASGALRLDVSSAVTPRPLDLDAIIDGKMKWGDEQDEVAAMIVHSKSLGDLSKAKSSTGVPILIQPVGNDGDLPRIMGMPLIVSDRIPLTGSTMSAVTSAGTTPPTITITGTPLGNFDLRVIATVLGARGTWQLKFSTDGGLNYSAALTSAATVALTDTAVDSLVGLNGATGITLAIAAGTAAVDNIWTATTVTKLTSLLVKKGALAFWYNKAALAMQTDRNILADTDIAAMHLYAVAHRYRRFRGASRSGVVQIVHN